VSGGKVSGRGLSLRRPDIKRIDIDAVQTKEPTSNATVRTVASTMLRTTPSPRIISPRSRPRSSRKNALSKPESADYSPDVRRRQLTSHDARRQHAGIARAARKGDGRGPGASPQYEQPTPLLPLMSGSCEPQQPTCENRQLRGFRITMETIGSQRCEPPVATAAFRPTVPFATAGDAKRRLRCVTWTQSSSVSSDANSGTGVQDCVELAVNGRDLCDLAARVEQLQQVVLCRLANHSSSSSPQPLLGRPNRSR